MPNAFDPSWYQSGMTNALSGPQFADAPEREPIDPNEPYRMLRGIRSGARGQPPMPEGLPPTMAGIATSAVDPFGIPSWALGKYSPDARDAWRSQYQNDPSGQIFGSMAPVPGMGFLKGPVNALGEAIPRMVSAAPKSIMAALGLGGASMIPSEAADSSAHQEQTAKTNFDEPIAELRKKIGVAEAPTKEMGDLTAKIQTNEAKLQALQATPVPRRLSAQTDRSNNIASLEKTIENDRKRHGELGDAQKKTLEAYRPQLADLEGKRAGIFAEARAKAEREQPMVSRNPWMQYMPWGAGGLAFASAYVPRMRALNAFNEDVTRMEKSLKAVDSIAAKAPSKISAKDQLAVNKLTEYESRYPGALDTIKPGWQKKLGDMGMGLAVGGPLAAELSMAPYQIDWASQGHDTPAYKAAYDRFTTPEGWLKTGASSIAGLTGGSMGGGVPMHRRPSNPDMAAVRATLATVAQNQAQRTRGPSLPASVRSGQQGVPPALLPLSYRARQNGQSLPQGGMDDLVKALTEHLKK